MQRLDFRWDMGFVDKDDYLAKRAELQNELALMQPIPQTELDEAAAILQNFGPRWLAADDAERKRFLFLVVQKLWVKNHKISAIMLRPNFYYLARQATNTKTNTEGLVAIEVRGGAEENACTCQHEATEGAGKTNRGCDGITPAISDSDPAKTATFSQDANGNLTIKCCHCGSDGRYPQL